MTFTTKVVTPMRKVGAVTEFSGECHDESRHTHGVLSSGRLSFLRYERETQRPIGTPGGGYAPSEPGMPASSFYCIPLHNLCMGLLVVDRSAVFVGSARPRGCQRL